MYKNLFGYQTSYQKNILGKYSLIIKGLLVNYLPLSNSENLFELKKNADKSTFS